MTLHAKLLPPVPPPLPPVFPAVCDTPEQAVKNSAKARSGEREKETFQAKQGQGIVLQLSATAMQGGKRP
jgi:hypothetical protein